MYLNTRILSAPIVTKGEFPKNASSANIFEQSPLVSFLEVYSSQSYYSPQVIINSVSEDLIAKQVEQDLRKAIGDHGYAELKTNCQSLFSAKPTNKFLDLFNLNKKDTYLKQFLALSRKHSFDAQQAYDLLELIYYPAVLEYLRNQEKNMDEELKLEIMRSFKTEFFSLLRKHFKTDEEVVFLKLKEAVYAKALGDYVEAHKLYAELHTNFQEISYMKVNIEQFHADYLFLQYKVGIRTADSVSQEAQKIKTKNIFEEMPGVSMLINILAAEENFSKNNYSAVVESLREMTESFAELTYLMKARAEAMDKFIIETRKNDWRVIFDKIIQDDEIFEKGLSYYEKYYSRGYEYSLLLIIGQKAERIKAYPLLNSAAKSDLLEALNVYFQEKIVGHRQKMFISLIVNYLRSRLELLRRLEINFDQEISNASKVFNWDTNKFVREKKELLFDEKLFGYSKYLAIPQFIQVIIDGGRKDINEAISILNNKDYQPIYACLLFRLYYQNGEIAAANKAMDNFLANPNVSAEQLQRIQMLRLMAKYMHGDKFSLEQLEEIFAYHLEQRKYYDYELFLVPTEFQQASFWLKTSDDIRAKIKIMQKDIELAEIQKNKGFTLEQAIADQWVEAVLSDDKLLENDQQLEDREKDIFADTLEKTKSDSSVLEIDLSQIKGQALTRLFDRLKFKLENNGEPKVSCEFVCGSQNIKIVLRYDSSAISDKPIDPELLQAMQQLAISIFNQNRHPGLIGVEPKELETRSQLIYKQLKYPLSKKIMMNSEYAEWENKKFIFDDQYANPFLADYFVLIDNNSQMLQPLMSLTSDGAKQLIQAGTHIVVIRSFDARRVFVSGNGSASQDAIEKCARYELRKAKKPYDPKAVDDYLAEVAGGRHPESWIKYAETLDSYFIESKGVYAQGETLLGGKATTFSSFFLKTYPLGTRDLD